MDPLLSLVLVVVIVGFLLIVGAPIGVALGLTGMWGLWIYRGTVALNLAATNVHSMLTSFVLVAAPLFILMGIFLEKGGTGKYLFEAASHWLGWMPGGLAIATVVACALASALSGISVAVVAAIAPSAVTEMVGRGYHRRVAAGAVCSAGGLGILIPPSIPLIFYGLIAEVSIGQLFIGGIAPGVMLTILYSIAIVIWRRLRPSMIPKIAGVPWQQRAKSTVLVLPALAVATLILGSVYLGIATPTESAAIGAIGIFVLGVFLYRQLTLKTTFQSIVRAAEVHGMCALLIVGGSTFGYSMAALGIPSLLADKVIGLGLSPVSLFLIINFIGLILGCFMDVLSILIILVPFTVPLVVSLGYNPVWWGVVLVMNGEIAVVTPPMGLNLYVAKAVTGISLGDIIKGTMPLLSCSLSVLVLLILFPDIVLWLPRMMMA